MVKVVYVCVCVCHDTACVIMKKKRRGGNFEETNLLENCETILQSCFWKGYFTIYRSRFRWTY